MRLDVILFRRRVNKSDPALASTQKALHFCRSGNGINLLRHPLEAYLPDRMIGPGDPFQEQRQTGRIGMRDPGQVDLQQRVRLEQIFTLSQNVARSIKSHATAQGKAAVAQILERKITHSDVVASPSRRVITASSPVAWISELSSVLKLRT